MKNRKTHIDVLKCLAVVMLLTIYIGAILFDGLHVIFDYHHHDAHQHCSVEIEASPCHQKIYHNNEVQGCDHKTHLIPERHDCDLCDALFAEFSTAKKEVEKTDVYSTPDYIPFFKDLKFTPFFYPSISLRGPPTLS